jgi:hypothetical protein
MVQVSGTFVIVFQISVVSSPFRTYSGEAEMTGGTPMFAETLI